MHSSHPHPSRVPPSQAGPGVKHLHENDWVVPLRPFLGTWRSLLVTAEKELLRIEPELMPMEQCAVLRESLTAYRLLEDAAGLRPGDCVALNAANSAVGQMVVQLAALLRLRTVAVIATEDAEAFAKTRDWLLSLGATVVLPDRGSLKTELDKLKFFAKPKLALDAVGGLSTTRLSDALADGGQLVVYGCMSGKSPVWPWHTWVFQGIQVLVEGGLLRRGRPRSRAPVEGCALLCIKDHGHLISHHLHPPGQGLQHPALGAGAQEKGAGAAGEHRQAGQRRQAQHRLHRVRARHRV